jgi:uncharacterized protein YndB with AHSA1/START domain
MRKAANLALLVCSVLLDVDCGRPLAELDRLAASGSIEQGAPVTTHLEIEISAPSARVWALLVDAGAWPKWQKEIESVKAPGPLEKNMRFSWRTGGIEIRSQVRLYESEHRLGWTGTAFTAKAIHLWELQRESDGRTLVVLCESMDGPFMATLYPSAQLMAADQIWLVALKRAAEGGS